MLMLTIQSDISAMANIQVPDASTIKIASVASNKPVRSVQILGEEWKPFFMETFICFIYILSRENLKI